jgi:4-amino-4-deoxy-L-arabinose transferase-like glycosyltransferase
MRRFFERVPSAYWLTSIIFLAFALRIARLDFQPLWWDEGWTVYFATSDIPSMVARTAIDIHPPFCYLLLHLWVLFLGSSPFAIRFFSLLVGVLSLPLIFLVARRLFNPSVGLLAALVWAVAPFPIYYSQEARMYALVTFLGLLSTLFALQIWKGLKEGRVSIGLWAGYILTTAVAVYTQYYAAFIPLAQTLFLARRNLSLILKWLAGQAIWLLLYTPWILFAGSKLIDYVATKLVKEADLPLGFATYMGSHLATFGIGHLPEPTHLAWLGIIPLLLAALGVGSALLASKAPLERKEKTQGVLFLLLYLFVPLLSGFLINLRFPFRAVGIERLLLLATPAFYILVALGLSSLKGKRPLLYLAGLVLIAVCGLSLFNFYTIPRYAEDDYRSLITRMETLAQPEDAILAVHPWQVGYFRSYYRVPLPSLYLTPKEETDVTQERWIERLDLMGQDLDQLLSQHPRLWFPTHQLLGRILENEVEEYLSREYYPFLGEWYRQSTKLTAYASQAPLTASDRSLEFGGLMLLQTYGVSAQAVEAAWGVIRVDLLWQRIAHFQERYRVALRLRDKTGYVWASHDSEPLAGLLPFSELPLGATLRDSQGLLVPAGTPPGVYQLRLSLYSDPESAPLEVRALGEPLGVEAILGEVKVVLPTRQPPIEALPIQHLRQADFEGEMRLLGYSLGEGPYLAGEEVEVTLFWQALTEMGEYKVPLRLEDESGKTWAQEEKAPIHGTYPTSRWPVDSLTRDPHRLLLPANLPPGHYRLFLGLHRSKDGKPLTIGRWPFRRAQELALTTIEVEGRAHSTEPPEAIQHHLWARLGDSVLFLGYDLASTESHPGGSLRLTLYWQALAQMETSYTVFTHLVDEEDRIWGQKDSIPGDWTLPTTSWIEGEYIKDEYEIPVKEDAPLGGYLIEIGMYDASTSVRLPIYDQEGNQIGDRLLLEETPIRLVR